MAPVLQRLQDHAPGKYVMQRFTPPYTKEEKRGRQEKKAGKGKLSISF